MNKLLAAVVVMGILSSSIGANPVVANDYSQPPTKVSPVGFSNLAGQVARAWAYDYARWLATPVVLPNAYSYLGPKAQDAGTYPPDTSYLEGLSSSALGDLGEERKGINGLDILLHDDTKYRYVFHENGLTFLKAPPGESSEVYTPVMVKKKQYQTLLASLEQAEQEMRRYPLWLANMRQSMVSKFEIHMGQTHQTVRRGGVYKDGSDFQTLFESMQMFTVKDETPTVLKNPRTPKTGDRIIIHFQKDVTFTLVPADGLLTIYASNMSYALRYELKDYYNVPKYPEWPTWGEAPKRTAK